ncbi:hypothetical protein FRB90_002582, partial [Tulasnella sp. 427]
PPPPPKRPRAKAKGKRRASASMEVEAQDTGEPEPAEEAMDMEAAADGGDAQDEFGRNSPTAMSRYLQDKRVPTPPMPKTRMDSATFVSDGMLLYVSQASYQPVGYRLCVQLDTSD